MKSGLMDSLINEFSKDEKKKITAFFNDELKSSYVITKLRKKADMIWRIIIGLFVVIILGSLALFIFKASMVFVLLWFIIVIPLGLCLALVSLIKFYRNRDKIFASIIKTVSRQALRIMIFQDNKRLRDVFIIYSKPSFEFEGGAYTIDEKCIYDYQGYPTVFYKQGIPAPLYFDFMAEINFFNAHPEKRNTDGVIGLTGYKLILTYSCETLAQLLKKKFFDEFLKGKNDDLYKVIVFGIVAIIILVIIVLVFRKPETVVQVMQNTPTP